MELWCCENLEEKDEWLKQSINQSINYEAVCITAPATPGLLNIYIYLKERAEHKSKEKVGDKSADKVQEK